MKRLHVFGETRKIGALAFGRLRPGEREGPVAGDDARPPGSPPGRSKIASQPFSEPSMIGKVADEHEVAGEQRARLRVEDREVAVGVRRRPRLQFQTAAAEIERQPIVDESASAERS